MSEKTNSQKRGCLVLGGVGLVGLLLGGMILISVLQWRGAQAQAELQRAYPAPGELVDVGGHRLHLYCEGTGSPTIILEAGLGDFSTTWALVQPEIAQTTRVCAYDRAGFGWSERSDNPRSLAESAADLHTLLQEAGVEGPYVLVGHSLGGLFSRTFAAQYPEEVVGMVLIDSTHEEVRSRSSAAFLEIETALNGQMKQQLGMAQRINALGVMALDPTRVPADARLPMETQAAYRAVLAMNDRFFTTVLEEYDMLDARLQEAQNGNLDSLGDLPLVVLEAGQFEWPEGAPELEPELLQAQDDLFHTLQVELAGLSTQGSLMTATESTHYIQLDQPDLVITAVADVIALSQ